MDQLLSRSWDYHTKLSVTMLKSSEHVAILKKFFNEVQMANEQYSKTLKQISEQFYHDISTEIIENEVLLCCYNYICHFILNVSHHHMNIANDIHNKILEPFQLFSENFQETNRTLLKNGQELIEDLENSKNELSKNQERYYKRAKEAEKFLSQNEGLIKKVDPNKKGQEELNYYTHELLNKQSLADQASKEYKNKLTAVNKKWETYDTTFYGIFDDFDLNEESRIHFTKLNISQMIKILQENYNDINNSMNDYSMQNFENKLKQMDENLSNRKQGGFCQIIDQMDFNQIVKLTKREEFIPYETWKKVNGKKKASSAKSVMLTQKENIEAYLNSLLSDSCKDKLQNKENENPKVKERSANSDSSLRSNESDADTTISFFDEEAKISEMLSTPVLRKHFLERTVLRTKDSSERAVSVDKWSLLVHTTFLTKEELSEHEQLYNLTTMLTKFYKNYDGKGVKKYLGSELRNKQHIWRDINFWENIAFYLVHRKKMEEHYRTAYPSGSNQINGEGDREEKKSEGKSLMQGIMKRFEGLMDQPKNIKVDEDSIKALIMDDINTYVSRLKIDQTYRSQVLLHVAKVLNLDQASLASIKNELERDDNKELFNKACNRWGSHNRKLQKKGKYLFAISLALDFLNYEENLTKLLLVNKEWKKRLEKKVYKIMLSMPDEKLTVKKRLNIWKSILHLDQLKIDYFRLKEKHNLIEQKVFPVEDIITMDVQRSFHNHPNINTMILYNLLRLFAHFNQKVSYCQGMNYIMGFLYCNFRDEDLAFRFFVAMVDKYMTKLFEHDLESLKTAFYQLDRMIGIFLPDLAKQFKKEGVDSSLFSASWFITVFTNVFQYSHTSYTLMRIWDIFLLEGWKGLFKVSLYVLKVYKDRLVRMRFDELLGFLNDLSSKEFFTNFKYNEGLEVSKQFVYFDYQPDEEEKPIRYFATQIDEIKVTKDLLRSLEEEFIRQNPSKAIQKNKA